MPNLHYHDGRSYADTTYSDLKFYRIGRNGRVKAVEPDNAGSLLYLGVELETDNYPDDSWDSTHRDAVAAYARELPWIRPESDGSLNNGVELVSAPMTLAAHKATDWVGLIGKVVEEGGHSHDTNTCGLHVHVSRAALGNTDDAKRLCIGKIAEFCERFQQELSCFARREIVGNGWASPTGYGHSTSDGSRAIRRKANALQDRQGIGVHDGRRYHVINLQNRSTVEFRLFKGTLEVNTLYATLTLVDGLVRWCKQHTTPEVHTLTWDGFIAWINDETLTTYWTRRRRYLDRFQSVAA